MIANAVSIAGNRLVPVLNPEKAAARSEDESELLARAQAGDNDAFCRLCGLHSGGLLRQATALCRDAGTAEDLVQETLVCLVRFVVNSFPR